MNFKMVDIVVVCYIRLFRHFSCYLIELLVIEVFKIGISTQKLVCNVFTEYID
jgi:hypothetical protein